MDTNQAPAWVTHLFTEILSLKASIESLKLTVDDLAKTVRYVYCNDNVHSSRFRHQTKLFSCHSDHSSNIMTPLEIKADYSKRLLAENTLSRPGSCIGAAGLAKIFFKSHVLMDCMEIRCALVSSVPLKLIDGSIAPHDTDIPSPKKAFKYEKPCMWREVDVVIPKHVKGAGHTVVAVVVADGSIVLVDWSAGQFDNLSDDTILFTP